MQITFLKYNGLPNTIFKTDFSNIITDQLTVVGDLVNSVDYRNPIIRVDSNLINTNKYNYCVTGKVSSYGGLSGGSAPIPSRGENEDSRIAGKGYYITNFTFINNRFCDIELKLDVLFSYAIQIADFDIILSRHESLFDMKLEDNMLPISSLVDVSVIYGYLGDFYDIYGTPIEDVTATITTTSKYSNYLSFFDGYNTASCRTFLCDLKVINKITQTLNTVDLKNLVTTFFDNNPSESIVSMVILPIPKNLISANKGYINENMSAVLPVGNGYITFDMYDSELNPVNDGVHTLKINKGVFSGGTIFPFGQNNIKDSLKFYDLEPYSNYELYIPFYGYVSLVYNNLSENTNMINLRYDVNLSNGDCIIYVEEFSNINPIDNTRTFIKNYCILNSNIGFKIPWGSTNALEIARNIIMTSAKVVVGIVTKNAKVALMKETAEIGVDSMTKDEYDIKDYKISSNQNIANTIISGLSGVHTTNSGNISSNLSKFANFMRPHIKLYKPTVLLYENYNKTIGRPSIYNGKIKNLPRFEFAKASSVYPKNTTGQSTYLLSDLDEILSILKTGFYL